MGCFSTKDPKTPLYHSPKDETSLSLWKGDSFDQYQPKGSHARWTVNIKQIFEKIRKSRPRANLLIADKIPLSKRREAIILELSRARVSYRRVASRTNSRTLISCLIPPHILLDESAPTITFVLGNEWIQSIYLGIINSLPFDWQARRLVEININYFMLENMIIPDLDDGQYTKIAKSAARLSAVDNRFDQFAQAVGVEVGPLDDDEHRRLRVDIDARVAQAWELTIDDLQLIFTDFTENAVPPEYRAALLARLEELT